MGALATAGPYIYSYLRRQAEDTLLKDQKRYQHTLMQASKGIRKIQVMDKVVWLVISMIYKVMGLKYAAIYLYDTEHEEYLLKNIEGAGPQDEETFMILPKYNIIIIF